ncbi:MAG: hypothetical protein IJ710_07790 [Prevotella sp.]|nr:hypothetical protein [Prevotella sp.]
MAQKKEIAQARTYIKSGKDFDKAEQLMVSVLQNDSAGRHNKRVYQLLFESVRLQYEAANEKVYLKQSNDTAAICNLTSRLFAVATLLDSVDALPDRKGRIRPEYRKGNAEELNTLRPNLYLGGTYNIKQADYLTAFRFFDLYIGCDSLPLFTGYNYRQTDAFIPVAAYWATFCGYKLAQPTLTLKYAEQALRDTSKTSYTLQYMAEAYRIAGDTAAYVKTLTQGFQANPEFVYFFPRLIEYYTAAGQLERALQTAEEALQTNPHSELFLFAKSTTLLHLQQYDECIAVSDTLIARNDSLAEPYFNAGTACLNQALALEQKQNPRLYRNPIRQLYQKARPYMEHYRQLAPDEKDKWAPALYRIYLNLNMGRQFEEIDGILNRKQ